MARGDRFQLQFICEEDAGDLARALHRDAVWGIRDREEKEIVLYILKPFGIPLVDILNKIEDLSLYKEALRERERVRLETVGRNPGSS